MAVRICTRNLFGPVASAFRPQASSFFAQQPTLRSVALPALGIRSVSSLIPSPSNIFQQKRFFASDAVASLSSADVQAILKKTEAAKFRQVLEKDGREKIDIAEYLKLASDNGIPEKEARKLAEAFSEAGVILYLSNSSDPALAKIIHLKPHKVSQALYQALDYHGVALAKRMGELQLLKERFERMKDVKDSIDEKAHRAANRLIWLGGAYLIAQAAVLARFTWWEFSWDIVEPITYFVTFTGGLIGYLYFATTKNEYTYENLRDRLARTRRERWYKKANFDPAAFEGLHQELCELEQELKPYLATTLAAPPASTTPPTKE